MKGNARKKLRAFQGENGLTDYRLAQLLQISRSGLSRIFRHGAQPSIAIAGKIEEATGGAVLAVDWMTPNQRRSAERAAQRVREELANRAGRATAA